MLHLTDFNEAAGYYRLRLNFLIDTFHKDAIRANNPSIRNP